MRFPAAHGGVTRAHSVTRGKEERKREEMKREERERRFLPPLTKVRQNQTPYSSI